LIILSENDLISTVNYQLSIINYPLIKLYLKLHQIAFGEVF